MSPRVMPKRYAMFSAVWPIRRPTFGSVKPFINAITGENSADGESFAKTPTRCPIERALAEVALNDTQQWRRDSPFFNAAATALGLTGEQLDALFLAASKIEL